MDTFEKMRTRQNVRLKSSDIKDLRVDQLEVTNNKKIKKEMKKKKKKKDVRVVRKKMKYVVVMINTNERFLQTTFYLVGVEKRLMKEMGIKFGYSMVVFPKKNYIFKSISYLQPKEIRRSLKEVHNLNFEFLPIEDNVISLELTDITRDLFVKNDKFVYQSLAEYLYKINLIFGRVNDYVFRGSLSQKVIEIFLKKVWESEICEQTIENDFHLIREWANQEFMCDDDDEEDEQNQLEKEYRMDGQGKKKNNKISESFLIPVPRDSEGKVIKEELSSLNIQENVKTTRNRNTFFHKGRKSNRHFSSKFQSNATNEVRSKRGIDRFTLDTDRLKVLQQKFAVDTEIKEESARSMDKSVDRSFDSHSDSEDFNPNKNFFTENSFDSLGFEFNNMINNFDLMIVMDRSNDLITPFVSQSSYMGLLDDLLKSKASMFY